MKYYIYPAGNQGKMLAHNLDVLELQYEFIDDLNPNYPSLEQKAAEIKDAENNGGGVTLLISCLPLSEENIKNHQIIRANLKKHKIKYIDGFKYIANKINDYIKLYKNPKLKTLIIHLYGRQDGRYDNMIPKNSENKLNLICISFVPDELKEYSKKFNFIFALPYHYLKLLKSADGIFTTLDTQNDKYISNNHKVFVMCHGYTMPILLLACDDKNWTQQGIALHIKNNKSKFLISSQTNYNLANDYYQERYQKYKKDKFLKFGYPPLDDRIKEYQQTIKQSLDAVMMCTRSYRTAKCLYPLIDKLLALGFKVRFRPTSGDNGVTEFIHIAQCFENNLNFIIDMDYKNYKQCKFNMQMLASMKTIISDYSSLAFTLPCACLRPAILFLPDNILQGALNKVVNGHHYSIADERIHIVAKTADEVIAAVQNMDLEKYKASIMDYRKNEIFNCEHSNEKLADLILQHL